MPENMQNDLDFIMDDSAAGFRLERFELYNWGTFNGRIWTFPMMGQNALLTGEIGSGKSTLVDAITTLLVPSNRASYNKAAGSEAKERTLRSYVSGYYKNERSDSTSARPVSLRGAESYSVILGVFNNESIGLTVTLAQVFWNPTGESQPERFFVTAERELSIAEHFTKFGGDIASLKKRLRASNAEVFDAFVKYKPRFMRALGIRSEQALNLFHQTVSMKAIGNLTDFVRAHMLEPFDVAERIDKLISHFENLTDAHANIVKARKQIEMLTPIDDAGKLYEKLESDIVMLESCINFLEPYFAKYRVALLEKKIKTLTDESMRLGDKLLSLKELKKDLMLKADSLKSAIRESGGGRIEELTRIIEQKNIERERNRRGYTSCAEAAEALSLPCPDTIEIFSDNRSRLPELQATLENSRASVQNKRMELMSAKNETDTKLLSVREELTSLRARRTNIPSRQVAIRDAIAAAIGTEPQNIPFVGELIKVKESEHRWEGAAERILHGFGLSMLVSDEYYKDVTKWAEEHHIGGRIVYYRVRKDNTRRVRTSERENTLSAKLEITPKTPLYDWLESEISNRFNHVCCDTLEDFRREPKAVTCAGQVKDNEKRHEKDDRFRIDDRSRYILGWDNKPKILLLEKEESRLAKESSVSAKEIAAAEKELGAISRNAENAAKLSFFTRFSDIDWKKIACEIAELEKERKTIAAASDKLKTLEEKHKKTLCDIEKTENDIETAGRSQQTKEDGKAEAQRDMSQTAELLKSLPEKYEECLPAMESYASKFFKPEELSTSNLQGFERQMRNELNNNRNINTAKSKRLSNDIVKQMEKFCGEYPLETQEFDAKIESRGEFSALLAHLKADDLPRFEEKFKTLLKEKAITEIASFNAKLNSEAHEIEERIKKINSSLAKIDYVPGRYIEMEVHNDTDRRIREFKSAIRDCTEGALGSSDALLSEERFAKVCALIEKFKGRKDCAEADKNWTSYVTDVRNWYSFSASEKWKETKEEYEHYTDSGGKSGGQKEKLAYTILAASLAYQFGIDTGTVRARTFRFVMIDEAFGRGSDGSARFALELFKTMNLQILLVTPMQKIHIIEPYIKHVGFIHNEDGKNSCLRTLTIEEYREEKEGRGHVDELK